MIIPVGVEVLVVENAWSSGFSLGLRLEATIGPYGNPERIRLAYDLTPV
jgi:hypothetical protein